MTKQEKEIIFKLLNKSVDKYYEFLNRDDYKTSKICVDKQVSFLQNKVFILAEFLYEAGFITFEKCCEYWSKIDFLNENAECTMTSCNANNNGICKYYKDNKGDVV